MKIVSFDWYSIVDRIDILTKDIKTVTIQGNNLNWSLSPVYPHCQYIDPYEYLEFKYFRPNEIIFHFKTTTDKIGISLFIEDKLRALKKRVLKSNMLAYTGPEIGIEDLSDPSIFKMVMREGSFQKTAKKPRLYKFLIKNLFGHLHDC